MASGRAAPVAAVLAFAACLLIAAEPARGQTQAATVPEGWPLIPAGSDGQPLFSVGERFRLLFVTSSGIKANSMAIGPYNGFVREEAAGNAALAGFSGKFSALISIKASTLQNSVDARDNTATTGAGVPIYWLNGAQVADGYADFYDGSWGSHAGRNVAGDAHSPHLIWTGSKADGTKKDYGSVGTVYVTTGRLGGGKEIDSGVKAPSGGSLPLYALSPVITVAAAPTEDSTPPTARLISRAGGTQNAPFEVTISFDENVTDLQLSEIDVTNGEASNLRGEGARYTVTITPSEDTSGSLTVRVPPDAVTDGAGNANTEAAQLTVPIDTRRPRVRITVENPLVEVAGAFAVTITFDERVKGFDLTDLEITNGRASNLRSPPNTPKVYVATITPEGSGTVIVHLPAGTVDDLDLSPNSNVASNRLTVQAKLPVTRLPPPTEQRVSADWPLIPEDSDGRPVARFRLLFVTSDRYTHDNKPWDTPNSIRFHNEFVQTAASRNAHLQGLKGGIRALISTIVTDARDNTATTGTGVPIYWLDGERVADDYADFYDGSWASYSAKNELGADDQPGLLWTGSNEDGTKADDAGAFHSVHRYHARVGHPADKKPIDGGFAVAAYPLLADGTRGVRSLPLYALSPVIAVRTDPPTTPTVTLTLSPDAIAENGGVSAVAARLDRASSLPTEVKVTATPEAPAAAGDFQLSGTTLTIPAGERTSTETLTITAVDNAVEAPDKTVTVSGTASNTEGVTGPDSVTLTIEDDDDGEPDYTRPTARIIPPPGAQLGPFQVTIVFSEPVEGFRLEDIAVENGTAGGFTDVGDRFAETYSATISPRAGFRGTVTVDVPADVATDSDGLRNEAAPPCPVEIVGAAPAPALKITLALMPDTIDENGGVSAVTATQDRASSAPTVVTVTATPDAPADRGDIRLRGKTLTIPPGRRTSTGTVTITAVDNMVAAPDKTVAVSATARNAQGVTGPEPVTLAIEDDDTAAFRRRLNRVVGELLPRVNQAMVDSTLAAITDRLGSAPSCVEAASLAGHSGLRQALQANAHALQRGTLRPEQVLSGTSFVLPLSDDPGPAGLACLWGSGDYRALAGDSGGVATWDGDIVGARLGADMRTPDDILTGVAVSWSEGEFDWKDLGGENLVDGTYESRVTSVHPYVGWSAGEGLRIWATVGHGMGDIEIDDAEAGRHESRISMRTAAAGARAELLANDRLIAGGTTRLRLKTEGFVARAEAEGGGLIDSLAVDTNRLRLALEASHVRPLERGGQWSPTLEAGVRHDGGDGDTGFGLEVGAGLRYEDPALGMTAETRARVLATHRRDREEWGIGGLVRLDPGGRGTGWLFSLMPTWGETAGGVQPLWEQVVAADEPADRDSPGGRVEAEVGYGLPALDGAGVVTPYTGLSLTDESREWHAGTRFRMGALDGEVSGAVARRASDEADYRVGIALHLPLGGGSAGGSGHVRERQSRPTSVQPAPRPETGAPARADPGTASSSAAAQPAPAPGPIAKPPSGPPAPQRAAVASPEAVAAPSSAPRWRVQLGAFTIEANAVKTRIVLATALDDILAPARHALVIDDTKADGLSRVVIDDAFTERGTAAALCAAIKARGPDCYVAPFRRSGTGAPARAEPRTASSTAAAQPAPGPVAKRPSAPRWRVQLGAFSRKANAVRTRTALATALNDLLVRTRHALVIDGSKADGLSRVVIDDAFAERGTAAALCAAIKARGPDCYVAPFRRSGTGAPARAEPGTPPSSAPAQPAPEPVAKRPSAPRAPERAAVASPEAVAAPSARRWRVQLGAFSREANAVRTRIALSTALDDILVRTRHALAIDGSKAGGLSRVVVDDAFAERGTAAALCAAIKARGPDCYVAPFRR